MSYYTTDISLTLSSSQLSEHHRLRTWLFVFLCPEENPKKLNHLIWLRCCAIGYEAILLCAALFGCFAELMTLDDTDADLHEKGGIFFITCATCVAFTIDYAARLWCMAELNPSRPWKARGRWLCSLISLFELAAVVSLWIEVLVAVAQRYYGGSAFRAARSVRLVRFVRNLRVARAVGWGVLWTLHPAKKVNELHQELEKALSKRDEAIADITRLQSELRSSQWHVYLEKMERVILTRDEDAPSGIWHRASWPSSGVTKSFELPVGDEWNSAEVNEVIRHVVRIAVEWNRNEGHATGALLICGRDRGPMKDNGVGIAYKHLDRAGHEELVKLGVSVMGDDHKDVVNKKVFTQDGANIIDPQTGRVTSFFCKLYPDVSRCVYTHEGKGTKHNTALEMTLSTPCVAIVRSEGGGVCVYSTPMSERGYCLHLSTV